MSIETRTFRQAELTMLAHVDTTDTYTTVIAIGKRYTGIGVAKRNPRDRVNRQLGLDLASARALRDLADVTERLADYS